MAQPAPAKIASFFAQRSGDIEGSSIAPTAETPAPISVTGSVPARVGARTVEAAKVDTMRSLTFSPDSTVAATSARTRTDNAAAAKPTATSMEVEATSAAAAAAAPVSVATSSALAAASMTTSPKRPASAMATSDGDIPPSATAAPAPKAKVYCDWSRHSSTYGDFYYNRVTKVSTWDEPFAYAEYLRKAGKARSRKASDASGAKRQKFTDAEKAALSAIREQQDRERAAKKLELAAAKAERERLRLEAAAKREAERLAKAKEKVEREIKRQAEAEQRRLEKVKRDAEKEAARVAKEEERTRKKAEREAAEAAKAAERERKKVEQERLRQLKKEEEEKMRLKKLGVSKGQASHFKSFFKAVAKKAEAALPDPAAPKSRFTPFHQPEGMLVAPINAKVLSEEAAESLDGSLERGDGEVDLSSMVHQWRAERRRTLEMASQIAAGTANEDGPEVLPESPSGDATAAPAFMPVAVGAESKHKLKLKLLQYSEDKRPAFYGTFRRKATVISARRPFTREGELDYEYDSGEDWEEEVEGDDCSNADSDSDGENEKEADDVDDGFFVAHGYLSDDEGADEVAERVSALASKAPAKDGEATKAKAKAHRLNYFGTRPHSFGCLWGEAALNHPVLGRYKIIPLEPAPIDVMKPSKAPPTLAGNPATAAAAETTPETEADKSAVPAKLYPELIKAVHGSCINVEAIATEFCRKHDTVTKVGVRRVLNDKSFCIREVRAPYKIQRRFVLSGVLEEHGLSDLPLPEPKGAPKVPSHIMAPLIKRVHGTNDSVDAIITDFLKAHGAAAGVSRMTIKRTVVDPAFAVRETRPPYTAQRRFVLPAVLAKYGLQNTPLPAPPPAAKSKPKKTADNGAQKTLLSAFKPV